VKRLCFLLLTTWFLTLPARADGIPIVGTAGQELNGFQFFQITSPTTAFSALAIDIEFGFPPSCSSTPCDLTVTISSPVMTESTFTWIDGTTGGHVGVIGSSNPGFVAGQVTFPNPGFVLALPPGTSFTLSGTIPFFGQLEGFLGTTSLEQIFSVDLSGTADYTFRGRENSDGSAANVLLTQFNFEGTATPVPEPSSLLLLGSGLMIFARWKRAGRGI
jgi:hypothetical protein